MDANKMIKDIFRKNINKNKRKFLFLVKILIIFFFFYSNYYLNINHILIKNNQIYNFPIYSIDDIVKKAKIYLNICLKGLLLKKHISSINSQILLSVVVPAYNVQKYIKSAIRSIQNQNMLNFEII